jgi:hypothetical protein
MESASPNRDRLTRTARRLGPLIAELVFVGGQMVELLVTDPAAVRVRPTDDVDAVVRVTSRAAYHALQQRLAVLGFQPDMRADAPLCRTRTQDGLILDVMPLDEGILGFSNRWYAFALDTATLLELEPGTTIRAITAPAFLATKWEAFTNRGEGDVLTSRDIEDILTLVAGRSSIVDEVRDAPEDVRTFIRAETRRLLAHHWADEIVENAVHDARHVPGLRRAVLERLNALASG